MVPGLRYITRTHSWHCTPSPSRCAVRTCGNHGRRGAGLFVVPGGRPEVTGRVTQVPGSVY